MRVLVWGSEASRMQAARDGYESTATKEELFAQADVLSLHLRLTDATCGIVRREDEMLRALQEVEQLQEAAKRVGVPGNREYNPGWHTALDLSNLLTISEAIARAAIERKESRGGHFRDDYPDKDPAYGTFNITLRKAADGTMQLERVPIPPMPPELKAVIEEMK